MIEVYTNDSGKECYRGVQHDTVFIPNLFHKPDYQFETDESFAFHSNLGSITVVDRVTGYGGGIRDTESGYRDPDGNFWCASGMQDVRLSGAETVGDAITWIITNANIYCKRES